MCRAAAPPAGTAGRGGDVAFTADAQLTTLLEFRYQRFYRAENGGPGQPERRAGRDGAPLVIRVPVGTLVRDVETGAILADMSEPGKTRTVLRGGRGGRGNARFATPTRQAPRFAQNGVRTAEREVELELKTIADVGLIGLPSVGKSTILSVLTAARPKIAAYHFTTLTPNLGVASRHGRSFVLADIPGLIEGAAEGAGLGHDFLRHIERTRLLIHVLDASGSEGARSARRLRNDQRGAGALFHPPFGAAADRRGQQDGPAGRGGAGGAAATGARAARRARVPGVGRRGAGV